MNSESHGASVLKIAQAFSEFGIGRRLIEFALDKSLSEITDEELADLRRKYRALNHGAATPEALFPAPQVVALFWEKRRGMREKKGQAKEISQS